MRLSQTRRSSSVSAPLRELSLLSSVCPADLWLYSGQSNTRNQSIQYACAYERRYKYNKMQSRRQTSSPMPRPTWRTGRNIRVVFDSCPFAPLSENMTSSTKPEVRNALHCRQRKTKQQAQVKCTENLICCCCFITLARLAASIAESVM